MLFIALGPLVFTCAGDPSVCQVVCRCVLSIRDPCPGRPGVSVCLIASPRTVAVNTCTFHSGYQGTNRACLKLSGHHVTRTSIAHICSSACFVWDSSAPRRVIPCGVDLGHSTVLPFTWEERLGFWDSGATLTK